jgi:hypothetical protein
MTTLGEFSIAYYTNRKPSVSQYGKTNPLDIQSIFLATPKKRVFSRMTPVKMKYPVEVQIIESYVDKIRYKDCSINQMIHSYHKVHTRESQLVMEYIDYSVICGNPTRKITIMYPVRTITYEEDVYTGEWRVI